MDRGIWADLIRGELVRTAYRVDRNKCRVSLDRTPLALADLFERWHSHLNKRVMASKPTNMTSETLIRSMIEFMNLAAGEGIGMLRADGSEIAADELLYSYAAAHGWDETESDAFADFVIDNLRQR